MACENAQEQRGAAGSTPRSGRCNRPAGEEGSALIEFALCVPILVTFFFGLIQVCLACYMRQVISETAREGTRYGIVHGSTCVTGNGSTSCTATAAMVTSFVAANDWPNIGGGTLSITTTYPDGNENPGSRVQVNATYRFPFKIPFVTSSTLLMSSTSVMYIVQ
jgi:Flp pilus assembly protein TadG